MPAYLEKHPEDERVYTWRYAKLLGPGEVITSSVWTATVKTGTDPNPGDILSGAPTNAGSEARHKIVGGVLGVVYDVSVLATTSLGNKIKGCADLAVVACNPE